MMSPQVRSLRRQGTTVALIGCVALLAIGLSQPRWLFGALTVWGYCLWLLFDGLETNHRDGQRTLLTSIGWPTLVTLLRGALLSLVAGFLFVPAPVGSAAFVPAASYTLASILDHIDGRLARALGRTTRLGEKLDMELDALGILVATLYALHLGKVPWWYLSIGVARYAFVGGTSWRRRFGKTVRALDPNPLRRILAGFQMGYLSVSLWPPIASEVTLFAAPFFGGATLAMFLRDWWTVSNRRRRR